MKKQGANRGATSAFLISTPESGIDSIAITYALMDPIMTVVRPLAAFITGALAGIIENLFSFNEEEQAVRSTNSCPVDNCCDGVDCPPEIHRNHHSFFEKIQAGIRYAVVDVWGDIVMWFFVGLLLAGCITALIPQDIMASWFGGGISSMVLMLFLGIPLYICATASTPIAAALIIKGVSPGAALVFLLVGPATNVTSLSVLTSILGKKGVIRYLLSLSGMALVFGVSVDWLYSSLEISPVAIIGEASEAVPFWVKAISSFVLIVLSIKPFFLFFKKLTKRKKQQITYFSDFPSISGKGCNSLQTFTIHSDQKDTPLQQK